MSYWYIGMGTDKAGPWGSGTIGNLGDTTSTCRLDHCLLLSMKTGDDNWQIRNRCDHAKLIGNVGILSYPSCDLVIVVVVTL